jgi:uncharacterized protein YbjT (DUF2867 family)
MILITGATGTNGREILKLLSAKGVRARAMVRVREDPKMPRMPGIEFVGGDFDDAPSLDAALAGIERAFLLSPDSAKQVARETNFIRAAKRRGVRHVVKFSILGAAADSPSRLIRRHGEAEKVLQDSGIAFTMLRPHYFMQNLLWFADDIKSRGVFHASLPDTYKHSHVDARDNAAVAVAALTDSGHEGKIHRITGSEALTYGEVADILSQAIGKKVRYDSSRERYAQFLEKAGLDLDEVLELDACVANGIGDGSVVTNTILEVTRQQPIRFVQFANDYSQAFKAMDAPRART